MNNYNFDGQPDGDWDDRGELSWQEYDWQQYLVRHEQEVEKFISLYNRLPTRPDRLDEVAIQMEWDDQDWSLSESGDLMEDSGEPVDESEEEDTQDDFDPYTILRHPVYVVVRGLFRDMRRRWAAYIVTGDSPAGATSSWALALAFAEAEAQATLALQSLDMGDFGLACCQMKLALDALNKTFAVLPAVIGQQGPVEELLDQDFRQRLFDLRDVCLRVLGDCRAQLRRKG